MWNYIHSEQNQSNWLCSEDFEKWFFTAGVQKQTFFKNQ